MARARALRCLRSCPGCALGKSEGFTRLTPSLVFLAIILLSMVALTYALCTLPIGTAYAAGGVDRQQPSEPVKTPEHVSGGNLTRDLRDLGPNVATSVATAVLTTLARPR